MVGAILANDDDTVPGGGSDVRSSSHRPCPGEQALPRRNALLSFPLRDLLLFCKPLSAHARASTLVAIEPAWLTLVFTGLLCNALFLLVRTLHDHAFWSPRLPIIAVRTAGSIVRAPQPQVWKLTYLSPTAPSKVDPNPAFLLLLLSTLLQIPQEPT